MKFHKLAEMARGSLRFFRAMACLVCVSAAVLALPSPGTAKTPALRVMSFNIRYANTSDGTNGWEFRKDLVAETIRRFRPDLLGMQEVLPVQADYLRKKLKGYAFYGVGREDGRLKGEMVPVCYKTNRFELLDAGSFWLSETPEKTGSIGWDAALPRIASWVLLRDRKNGRPLMFCNTHLDHRGSRARAEAARLIRERGLDAKQPLILTGDFNTTEDREPYAILTRPGGSAGKAWMDAYRVLHPQRSEMESSFGAWKGARRGQRIDFIFHTPEWIPQEASIDYTHRKGRYPSDHYPMTAVLKRR